MAEPPAGAQYSPDGAYWWDETEQQWQLVSPTGQAGGAAAGSSPEGAASSSSADAASSSSADATGSSSAIDASGLIATLEAISSMDEEALARSSSSQLDEWIASLSQWHDHLSSNGQGIA
jgi:hypothetical protein